MARERTAWRSPDERAVPAVAVILVRHGMPEIQRGVASTRWRLSEAAKEDCVLLAHALPAELGPVVYSSAQAKAQETATVIALRRGLRTEVDERLREVEQPPGWVDDYRAVALGYLAGRDGFDWEPREAVVRRFGAAVTEATDAAGARDIVVVNHGLAMSLWVADVVSVNALGFDITRFWHDLSFPDAWRVEPEHGTLQRLFNGGTSSA
jgi:broad specificity phosphatase PhoE